MNPAMNPAKHPNVPEKPEILTRGNPKLNQFSGADSHRRPGVQELADQNALSLSWLYVFAWHFRRPDSSNAIDTSGVQSLSQAILKPFESCNFAGVVNALFSVQYSLQTGRL